LIDLGKEHPNSDGCQDASKHQVEPSCAFVSAKFIGNLVSYSGPNRKPTKLLSVNIVEIAKTFAICRPPSIDRNWLNINAMIM
jgi:hypothetical protein